MFLFHSKVACLCLELEEFINGVSMETAERHVFFADEVGEPPSAEGKREFDKLEQAVVGDQQCEGNLLLGGQDAQVARTVEELQHAHRKLVGRA